MLNIKNPEAHRLARELAEKTGESLTQAVVVSLQERLDRVREAQPKKATAEEIMRLAAEIRAHIHTPWEEGEDPTAFLYDERGLPA